MSARISPMMQDYLRRVQEAGEGGYRAWRVSRTVDALVSRGLVRSEPEPGDPLSCYVRWFLTDAGKAVLS